MRAVHLFPLLVLVSFGCSEAPPPQHIQAWVNSWAEMGMYLPDQEQVDFLRANLTDVSPELAAALSHSNPDIRQRAAYVLAKIGPDAAPLGPALLARLNEEPDRLVRIYIYDALAAIGYSSDETTTSLKRSFDSLGDENQPPQPLGGYAEVDEKITVGAALFELGDDGAGDKYLDFVIQWLRPPSDQMTHDEVAGYWERRWIAVNSLEGMPNATKAIPLLESMLNENGAKPWVALHVPRVLGVLTKTPKSSEPIKTTSDPAQKILDRVVAAYNSMQTYKAEGTITSHIEIGGSKTTTETSFSILLKKPNLYLISWNQKNMAMPAMAQSGAVWNDGTQPYLYMGIMNAYSKMGNDEIALERVWKVNSPSRRPARLA